MPYDELVKRLRNVAQWADKGLVITPSVCLEAADAIEELQQQVEHYHGCMNDWFEAAQEYKAEMPRWIPVTERLPDGGSRILVCSKLRDGQYWQSVCRFANNLHEVDEYDFPKERRPGFYYYDDEYGWIEKTGVTHWMPLPEPPKEETC